MPVLHQNAARLPAFGRMIAGYQIADLAFAYEAQRRHRDPAEESSSLSDNRVAKRFVLLRATFLFASATASVGRDHATPSHNLATTHFTASNVVAPMQKPFST